MASGESKNRNLVIAAVAIIALGAAIFLLSGTLTEEERIYRVLEAVRVAVEDRSARDVVEHVDPAYRGSYGRESMDRQGLRQALNGYFFQAKGGLTCVIVPLSIDVTEGSRTATAHFQAAVFDGISITGVEPPGGGRGFDITVTLRKGDDDEWRISGHELKPVRPGDVWRQSITGADD